MMFSDEEIKEVPETGFMRPGDEIISIKEVCLNEKYYKKKYLEFNREPLLTNSSRNDLDSRLMFRDGFYPDGSEQQQARFAWTEEEIADLVSEPGFGTTGQTSFSKDLDAAFKSNLQEADTSSSVFQPTGKLTFNKNIFPTNHQVSSTSGNSALNEDRNKTQSTYKVDKTDPRSRYHYVKYVKRHGRTVKLWECGICSREFQHQYTLMRHLPTHTDERNFHCGECGKSFRQLSTLSQHRAIHSAERPYACEMCNKTFNRVSTLISHRKTHNFEKPYRCHICPKGFHQKGNLRNHLFTHTNERPYRCNICFKGFNQQSNLVCHKNKAHPDVAVPSTVTSSRSTPITCSPPETGTDRTRPQAEHCEVSSTVSSYLPSVQGPSTSDWTSKPEEWVTAKQSRSSDVQNEEYSDWSMSNGVIVDPIKTYHMGVALATRQTPFALLKPHNGTPVLVKVVDTNLPGGKQMLVPATAEDFKIGSQILIKDEPADSESTSEIQATPSLEVNGAVQIKVPVVATVMSTIKAGGRLELTVEEPHHAYHSTLPSNGEVKVESCSPNMDANRTNSNVFQRLEKPRLNTCNTLEDDLRTGTRITSICALPPPAPSPPLDFISMDLFEPMECIPLGPQITAVDNDEPPPSDDSDIFIGEFEESIPLSDSD